MRVGILTSSRADYGIYRPLLKALKEDSYFKVSIIAFGTHLSKFHGYTIDEIIRDGYHVDYTISSLMLSDDKNSVSVSMGLTTMKFSDFWEQNLKNFDLVFCLGDRFEMFAAVMSGLVYGVPFAHIHGGEITLGAIDNVFRNSITMASKLHFVAAKYFAERVSSLLYPGKVSDNIIVCGALSLDNLQNIALLTKTAFFEKWNIDLNVSSVLVTIHPETIAPQSNEKHLIEVCKVLNTLKEDYQLIITMPNADTFGSTYRTAFIKLSNAYPEQVRLIENFGTQSYFTCMQHVDFLLGNTSSGIIEAASFNKYVINIGSRQEGRLSGENVLHAPIDYESIMSKVKEVERKPSLQLSNIYYNGGAAKRIVEKLKQYNNSSSDKN